jgi:hypothetical protein
MSMPLPQKRSAGNSGGMLRRDSKKVKGGLNHRFERPMSNISLPVEDSIHSSMSGGSETRAFRVSALDMFSPRPKIRCSVGSQYYYRGAGPSPTSDQEKDPKRREWRNTFSREGKDDKRSSRIDELADTLDAGALREIMDRDKRRRDKKKKSDDERLRRRLERRAEKQRAVEAGLPASPRRVSRGAIGLGIEKEMSTSTPMEDVRPSTPPQQRPRVETATPAPKTAESSQLPTPLESPVEDPVVSNAKAVRYSRGSVSSRVHTRGPSNISQVPALLSEIAAQETPVESIETVHVPQDPNASGDLHAVVTADTTISKKGTGRRRSSEGRRMSAFASFFRRKRSLPPGDVGRTTPSEVSFSNTSRESMSRQPLPAHLVALPTQPIQIKRAAGAPHRTMSKFREDLPEFPLSPPDSRMHSPETTTTSSIAARRQSQPPPNLHVYSNSPQRTDSPVSPGVATTGVMSQSLASVDSEGSWLSGRPIQRRSNKSHIRSSVGSSTLKRNDEFNASYEELGIPDDEYFRRLTPGLDNRRKSVNSTDILARKASSTAMVPDDMGAESDEADTTITEGPSQDKENLLKDVVGRKPTIVHRQARHKSTEGLLSFYTDNPNSTDGPWPGESSAIIDDITPEKESLNPPETPTSPESPASDGESMQLQRAQSVDLGKRHVRQLSAGSAKLLNIQKRSSTSSHSRLTEL